MAYEKHTWTTGEVITAGKLNNMEDGIASAGGVMVVSSTYDNQTEKMVMGKTWQEIHDALREGVLCIVQGDVDETSVNEAFVGLACSVNANIDGYNVYVIFVGNKSGVNIITYTTDATDGYPSVED